jgi:ADP-ribose pyrophosphatase
MPDHELLLRTPRFEVIRKTAAMPGGRMATREIVHHPGAVVILPLLDDGRVCLIDSFRISLQRRLVELPAGTLEPGEEPLVAARRELIEETGFRARQMEPLLVFYPSPGILDEKMHLFLATGLEPGAADLQPDEDIRPLPTTWDDALEMIRRGRIEDAKTLAGLLYYHVFRR